MTASSRRRVRVAATCSAVIAVAVVVRSQPQVRPANPQTNPDAWLALAATARNEGAVRVIVGIAAPFRTEGQLAGVAGVNAQRAGIAVAQENLLQAVGYQVQNVKRFETVPYIALSVDAAAFDTLQSLPGVTTIQEDVPEPPTLAQSGPLIGAPTAWAQGYSGGGWTVAVLDTGVETSHPFLAGKVVSEACYSTTNSSASSLCPGGSNSTAIGSGVNCSGIPSCYHGTHVAGIAAGRGSAFSGIARDASIIAIQVFSNIGGSLASYSSDQMLGLERVYALRTTWQIASVNMSLGGSFATANCDSDPRKTIIDNLRAAGIATVISSGNDGYTNALSFPACISTAISVGSTTKADALSGFSNVASFLSLLAPGSSINSSLPGGTFGVRSGTSMAAPHVAGAWAVMKSATPSASVTDVFNRLAAGGTPITDTRTGAPGTITKPRISVATALCTYVVSVGRGAFAAAGGTGTVSVTAGAG